MDVLLVLFVLDDFDAGMAGDAKLAFGGGLLPGFADERVDGFVISLHAVHAADLSGRNMALAEARKLGVLGVVLQRLFGEFFGGSVGDDQVERAFERVDLGDLFGLDGFLFSHRSSLYKHPSARRAAEFVERGPPQSEADRVKKSFPKRSAPALGGPSFALFCQKSIRRLS